MAHARHQRVVAILMGAIVLWPHSTASATHPATFPARNGLIAFQADTGSGYQLYAMSPNGHNLQQITHVTGDALQSDWSPDGRQIVFEFDHPDGSCAVEVMNADGSNQVDLTTGANPPGWNGCEAQPSFAPDGATIVFERYDPVSTIDAIWSMNLTGGDRREITAGTNNGVTDPNVSPDGKTVSFIAFDGTTYGSALFTVGLDGSNLTQFTPFTLDVAIKHDWAPDGRHIVLSVTRTSSNAVAAVAGRGAVSKACPVPDSGTCLGKLAAGKYSSRTFQPTFSFRVPSGWANYLDVSGLYLLQPPGATPPGNFIAGSFIGLETSVAPEAFDCQSRIRGVRTTPSAIAAWMTKQRGLVISHRHSVVLGGLHGVALDLRMARGAKGCLSTGATVPAVPLLVGTGPSSFDHEVAPGYAERHYLLGYEHGTLDVAVVDASGGRHLASYDAIVRTFRFAR